MMVSIRGENMTSRVCEEIDVVIRSMLLMCDLALENLGRQVLEVNSIVVGQYFCPGNRVL